MASFKKQLATFYNSGDNASTHLSLAGGKYTVPSDTFDKFYKMYYYNIVLGNEKVFLVEKVNKGSFSFFLDIEYSKDSEKVLEKSDILSIIDAFDKVLPNNECLVTRRRDNYHVHYYNCTSDYQACIKYVQKAKEFLDPSLHECIDTSVYKTGLRMIKSLKKDTTLVSTEDYYRIYNIVENTWVDKPSYEDFLKTCILKKEFVDASVSVSGGVSVSVSVSGGVSGGERESGDEQVLKHTKTLIQHVMATVSFLDDAHLTDITFKNLRYAMHSIITTTSSKFCPFKHREHKRESNPVYMIINLEGAVIKCHDIDCKGGVYEIKDSIELVRKHEQIVSFLTQKTIENSKLDHDTIKILKKSLKMTHYSVAKAFFHIFENQFAVDETKNCTWYRFKTHRWERSGYINLVLSNEFVEYYHKFKDIQICLGQSKERIEAIDKVIALLESCTFKNSVLQQLMYMYNERDPGFADKLDSHTMLLGFDNGVYDFKNMSFRDGKPDDYITFTTGYDFKDGITADREYIMTVLSKILPDIRILTYMLKVLGKTLVGKPDERFYVLTGISGANGKSTLMSFMETCLGDYATAIDIGMLTTRRKNPSNASPDIFRLKGKRFLNFQEPESDDKLNTGMLKQFSGGDTIVARDLYKSPTTFTLQGNMFLCCNDTPDIKSCDGGTWRRIKVIEFNSRFTDTPNKNKPNEFQADHELKYKIKTLGNDFINILIKYYKLYLSEGLGEPPEVNAATLVYKNENNKFETFIETCYIEDSDEFCTVQDMYVKFSFWWSEKYPNTKIPSPNELKRALKAKYGREKTKMVDNIPLRGFELGVRY